MRDAAHHSAFLAMVVASVLSACDDGDTLAALTSTRTSTAAPATPSRTATPPQPTQAPTATTTPAETATATASATSATATPSGATSVQIPFDFSDGAQGWIAGFADYPPANEESFEFDGGIRALPPELGSGSGFLLSSHNRSDDVFMFLARRVGAEDGLQPATSYLATFNIVFGSNAQTDCSGIGGAPGESVFLKAGISPIEPTTALDCEGVLRLNLDKGDQGEGGSSASVAGNIANGIECGTAPETYVSLERTHTHPVAVESSDAGTLWLLVGTDSGYEGVTALYYQRIQVELTPQS